MDRHKPEFLDEWDDAITQIEHDHGVELFSLRGLPRLPGAFEQYDRRVGHDRVDRVLDGSHNNGAIFPGLWWICMGNLPRPDF